MTERKVGGGLFTSTTSFGGKSVAGSLWAEVT